MPIINSCSSTIPLTLYRISITNWDDSKILFGKRVEKNVKPFSKAIECNFRIVNLLFGIFLLNRTHPIIKTDWFLLFFRQLTTLKLMLSLLQRSRSLLMIYFAAPIIKTNNIIVTGVKMFTFQKEQAYLLIRQSRND